MQVVLFGKKYRLLVRATIEEVVELLINKWNSPHIPEDCPLYLAITEDSPLFFRGFGLSKFSRLAEFEGRKLNAGVL